MKKEEVRKKLIEILCNNFKVDSAVEIDTQAELNSFGIDSMNIFKFLVQIEKAFEFEFDEDDLENVSVIFRRIIVFVSIGRVIMGAISQSGFFNKKP